MDTELTDFLRRNRACAGGIARLEASGAETLADAWEKAAPKDLVWAVTRPGVMSKMQRRKFLSEAVLAPIEHLLTDERSKNILQKLRTNEQIMQEDKDAAQAARADAESWAAEAYAADAADAAAWAAALAASAAADVEDAAADAAWAAAAEAAMWAAQAAQAARGNQAAWIRSNFRLAELHTN